MSPKGSLSPRRVNPPTPRVDLGCHLVVEIERLGPVDVDRIMVLAIGDP